MDVEGAVKAIDAATLIAAELSVRADEAENGEATLNREEASGLIQLILAARNALVPDTAFFQSVRRIPRSPLQRIARRAARAATRGEEVSTTDLLLEEIFVSSGDPEEGGEIGPENG